jgi:hypothetical protein
MLLAACGWVTAAQAQTPPAVGAPPELMAELPGARLQGRGRQRANGLPPYELRLWAGTRPVGDDWPALPFALELIYARAFSGEQIAEHFFAEMRQQSEIDEASAERWLGTLKALLPDVHAGDRVSGVHLPGGRARFFMNGKPGGELREAELVLAFFGIWLSARSPQPALRKALLGR